MRHLLSFLVLYSLIHALPSAASPIPASQTVEVNGVTWAQVDIFSNLKWVDINAACPADAGGVCKPGSTLHGLDMEGWTWASVDSLNIMFNYYLAKYGVPSWELLNGPSGYYKSNGYWTPALLSAGFRPTQTVDMPPPAIFDFRVVSGLLRDSQPNPAYAYSGAANQSPLHNDPRKFGSTMATNGSPLKTESSPYVGAWFFQAPATLAAGLTSSGLPPLAAPIPLVVPVVSALTLAGIGGWRLRRKKQ